jgi:hypothetical protein
VIATRCRNSLPQQVAWGSGGRGFKSRRPDYLLKPGAVWGSVSAENRPHFPELALLAHDGEERFVIGLLVTLQKRFGVLPATGRGNVLQRVSLSLRRPFAAIGMPQPRYCCRYT